MAMQWTEFEKAKSRPLGDFVDETLMSDERSVDELAQEFSVPWLRAHPGRPGRRREKDGEK